MDVKVKRVVLVGFLLLFLLQLMSFVSATPMVPVLADNVFIGAIDKVINFFNLDFFRGGNEDRLMGILRLMTAITVFSLVYWGFRALNGVAGGGDTIPQGIAITISIVASIMTLIFLPAQLLIIMGQTYALVFVLVFFGLFFGAFMGLYIMIDVDTHSAFWIFRAALICAAAILVYLLGQAALLVAST